MPSPGLQERISELSWYHRIDLGNGIVTQGICNTGRHLPRYRLPEDLSGKSVVDIGAFNGFFTFEAIRRNATRTLSLDRWSGDGCAPLANFEIARQALGMDAPTCDMSLYDMTPDNIGRFDISLFLGVLYHLEHPQLGLNRVSDITDQMTVIESYVDALDIQRPAGIYYPADELGNCASNFWGFNPLALEAMTLSAGFARVEPVSLYFAPDRGKGEWVFVERGKSMTDTVQRIIQETDGFNHARVVYHAYK